MQNIQRYWIACYIGLLFFLVSLIPTLLAKADVGTKPSMDFYFVYPQKDISAIEGKLLLCLDEICNKYKQFDGTLYCKLDWCTAWAVSAGKADQYVEYHKIIVTFTDGVRESNVFTKKGYQAKYEVQVEKDYLVVKEKISLGTFFNPLLLLCFSAAAFLTILVETIIAKIYTWATKTDKSLLWYIVLANIFSLPIVWFALSQIETPSELIYLCIAEPFAVIFEALFLIFFGRKIGLSNKQAILLSVVMNLASFLTGWLILYKFTS